jgi:hypothetical protein
VIEGVVSGLTSWGEFDTQDSGCFILSHLARDAERLAGQVSVLLGEALGVGQDRQDAVI